MSNKLSPVEGIKERSRGLRGSLDASLANQVTGQLAADDQQLVKFHGIYQQDDRDRRSVREEKRLEWAYSFMVRLRIPGGDINAAAWRGLAEAVDKHANGVIKITTRQTVQFHGLVKSKLRPTLQDFDKLGFDAIAACGDVNRNVMAGSLPSIAPWHDQVFAFADKISQHLLPKSRAYQEIWLDGEKLNSDQAVEEDPLYKTHYLPRKFKIGIAIPPHNEVDIFTQDIGLIAVADKEGQFCGFNVAVGGGMGRTHGNEATYPRLGSVIGYIDKEQTLDTVWHIVAVQRDFGNREDRKLSRLKYTIDRMGVDGFKTELESRLDFKLQDTRPYKFTDRGDVYGWQTDHQGLNYYTLFVENGRVIDQDNYRIASGLKAIAELDKCGFRFTGNQNVMLTGIQDSDCQTISSLLTEYGLNDPQALSPLRQHALACVALNTCPLAMAEAQRYLPTLITKIEDKLQAHELLQENISIRMTGCPNGCARPYVAEIGLVGKSTGRYDLHLGASATGERLNRIYRESLNEGEILDTLDSLFAQFCKERTMSEEFGDFCHRILFEGQA